MKNKRQPASRVRDEPASSVARMHPVEWVVEANAVNDVLREMNARLRRRRRVRASGGGIAALLLVAFVWHQWGRPEGVGGRVSSAIVSVPDQQVLPDGSVVQLRPGARISVAFTDTARRVFLNEGEAHFQVARQSVPFVVSVSGVDVRAVGTAFSVQLGGNEIEVVVTEGVVAVEHGSNSQASPGHRASITGSAGTNGTALVEAGNRVFVPARATSAVHAPTIVPIAPADLAARLAWRAPRLEFSRTPLVQALALIAQHAAPETAVKVTLADDSLGRVEVSGVLRADNLETLLRLLEEEHGIRSEHVSPREIVLRKGK